MMPKFITRVELHGATGEDYKKLHLAMVNLKFSKAIVDDNGTNFTLPSAEYFSHGPQITASQVRDLAVAAAQTTGRPHSVLVSEYNNAAWTLPLAPQPGISNNVGAPARTNKLLKAVGSVI